MRGKTCVITGATSGIGLVAAQRLAAMGADLVLVGRDPTRGELALESLRTKAPHGRFTVHYADLSSMESMRRLAGDIATVAPRIDVLVNNAGAIFNRRTTTADGLERTFALNHMGYFLMTALLRARITERIVNVASVAHRGARLDFGDLQTVRGYGGWLAYRRSKLCNILFTAELAHRLAGTGVTANSLHPGFVATRFGDNNDTLFRSVLGLGKRMLAIAPEEGAETLVHLASSPDVAGISGGYFDKCREREPAPPAQDLEAAGRLWRESERLAGVRWE
jgi:NAD(P)-dependent dehydrogenase (short-subunit alcohol dehydrogenase family)